MTTPQEPTPSRIVPFRQRPVRPARNQSGDVTAGLSATVSGDEAALVDQLLSISTIADPLPGEQDQVHHLRAVQLGTSSGAFYPHTLTEDVPLVASQLGLTAIEIMLQTQGEYDSGFVRRVAANATAAGVSIHAVHSLTRVHPFLDPYPRRVDEAWTLFHAAIEACVVLDARVLVWHGPHRNQVATDEGWERFIELTHDLARACGEAGITLGIENVSYGALALVRHVVNFATRLAEIGDQHQVGFVFDPFQAAEAGANPFMMLA
ncbi:MAG: sugar phosphate isomerase/epimerase, partial [Chloroflexia bacterium]|nr:sugar phosphate isomerase/epimerase [Chloroflexia bacterium]